MFHRYANTKSLIIRFSSFGDIVQSSFVADSIKQRNGVTDLLTKKDFAEAFKNTGFSFRRVYSYDKSKPFALWSLAKEVSKENYDLIYDAHNNQRTLVFKFFLILLNPLNFIKFKTRSKYRLKRFFLFNFNLDFFPKPFKGALSFLDPLKIELNKKVLDVEKKKEILLAPSAAWDLKKWPAKYWIELGLLLEGYNYEIKFIGGPQDSFIEEVSKAVPSSENLAGKLSWKETINNIKSASLLISGDTGVLHIADYFGTKAIALMGPSAFGRPSRKSSYEFYKSLPCQPCSKDGRGKCKNVNFKDCLVSISPNEVSQKVNFILGLKKADDSKDEGAE